MLVNVLLSCKLPDVLHLVLKAGQIFTLDYIHENMQCVFVGGKGLRMHTQNVNMSLFIPIIKL